MEGQNIVNIIMFKKKKHSEYNLLIQGFYSFSCTYVDHSKKYLRLRIILNVTSRKLHVQ